MNLLKVFAVLSVARRRECCVDSSRRGCCVDWAARARHLCLTLESSGCKIACFDACVTKEHE